MCVSIHDASCVHLDTFIVLLIIITQRMWCAVFHVLTCNIQPPTRTPSQPSSVDSSASSSPMVQMKRRGSVSGRTRDERARSGSFQGDVYHVHVIYVVIWALCDVWFVMCDVWWVMCDVWWVMGDEWWVMYDVWWVMCDVWWVMCDGWCVMCGCDVMSDVWCVVVM